MNARAADIEQSCVEINAVAWLCWLCGIAALPLTSRNPLYLTLAMLIAVVVYLSLPRRGAAARAWRLFAVVGVSLAVLSIGFNVLTVHVGDRPFATLPRRLPIIGGPLTWNAVAYGVVRALAIATLLIGATAFNTAVRHGDLVRLLPGSLARLGIVASIALTMVPQTIAAGRDIVDAQRSRGHRVRGVRDAAGLVVPLLAVGMERAVTLSEALEARGFGAPAGVARRRARVGLLPAAIALLAGLVALGMGRMWLGLGSTAIALALALVSTSPAAGRTRLRGVAWDVPSIVVVAGAAAALLGLLAYGLFGGASLSWDPFPRLTAPAFEPFVGATLLGLLAPVLATEVRR